MGVNFGFIKDLWIDIKGNFMRFLLEFYLYSRLVKWYNCLFIDLIPKVSKPHRLADFTPISLVWCMYKVLAKVLVGRLKLVIDKVILKNNHRLWNEDRYWMIFLLLMKRYMMLKNGIRSWLCLKSILTRRMIQWIVIIWMRWWKNGFFDKMKDVDYGVC